MTQDRDSYELLKTENKIENDQLKPELRICAIVSVPSFIYLYRLPKLQIFIDLNALLAQDWDRSEQFKTENEIEIDQLEPELCAYFEAPPSTELLARP